MDLTTQGVKTVDVQNGCFIVDGAGVKLYFPLTSVECVRVDSGTRAIEPLGIVIDLNEVPA